jgi:hypothetical protein
MQDANTTRGVDTWVDDRSIKDLILFDTEAQYRIYCAQGRKIEVYDFLKRYYTLLNNIESKKQSSKDPAFFQQPMATQPTDQRISEFRSLFDTYVKDRGLSPINFSYQCRNNLTQEFAKTTPNVDLLLKYFVAAAEEAETLLGTNTTFRAGNHDDTNNLEVDEYESRARKKCCIVL